MKKRVARIVALSLVGLFSAAFAAAAGEEEMAVFTMSEKGESCIQAEAGKPFAIRFPSTPGTGYHWERAAEPDQKLLAFVSETIEEPERARLGGSEFVIWKFQALAVGETEIAMRYVRPWEKQLPPARTYVFKVRIR